jgi:peptidoglycan/LPS O-acetylase OafA/YrhL
MSCPERWPVGLAKRMVSQSKDRVLALDGIRGLALLMVMFFHLGMHCFTVEVVGKLPSKVFLIGASGVELFFVLSGFLITGILLDQKRTPSRYFSRFYVRRCFRIFPLYFSVLAIVLVVLPNLFDIRCVDTVRGNPVHLWIYTTNLWVSWRNDWCYGPLNHFWSVAIEEQFYVVWPLVVFALSIHRLFRLCVLALIAFVSMRICCSLMQIGDATEKAFTLFRMDGLLLGAIAAIMVRSITELTKLHVMFRWFMIMFICLYAGSLILGENDYTIRYTLTSGIGMFMILATLSSRSGSIERTLLESRLLRSLGKYSYAMYLFQGPLIAILFPYLAYLHVIGLGNQSVLAASIQFTTLFALTYGLAVLSWYYCESPFLNLGRKLLGDSQTKHDPQT